MVVAYSLGLTQSPNVNCGFQWYLRLFWLQNLPSELLSSKVHRCEDPCTFHGLTEPSGIWAPRPRVHCWPARLLCSMLAPTLSPHVERPSSAGLRLLTARRGIITHFASSGGDAEQESDQQELVALTRGSAKPSPALWLRIFSNLQVEIFLFHFGNCSGSH